MYRVYTAPNFTKELIEVLKNITFSFELLVSKDEIIEISKSIFYAIEKDIHVKIIVSSDSSKKSIRIYNLINRLIDCGVEVYWNTDSKIYKLDSHFIIADKVNVINKIFYNSNDDVENQVIYFSDIFSKILTASTLIELNSNQIKTSFSAEKTYVKPFETVIVKWKIQNADIFEINPKIESNKFEDETIVQIENDTLFKLSASNKNQSINKFLFIKVYKSDVLNFYVKVFDPILNEIFFLSPLIESGIEKYSCYLGQSVSIGFKSDLNIILKDKEIGKLFANKDYNFKLNKSKDFNFKYTVNGVKKQKIIKIISHSNESILQKINIHQNQSKQSFGFIKSLKNFFNKLEI